MSSDAFDETADAGTGTTSAALIAGMQLGKYRLDRVLGEGGMGVVWAAHDPDLERAVAIKVLRYAEASAQLRQRLLREARAMAKLKHPNVLTVYEVGTVGDRDYIAMELVDGQSLDTWLQHATYEERWQALLAAGRGLAAAHAAGLVHRDFKPHNILRSRDGRVLVTDFGLARGLVADEEAPAFSATRSGDAILDTPMTQTGALIGTPAYMAPEQYEGATPDPRTDQFAFCVTAWQALTGERPFKGATLEEMRVSVGRGVAHIQTKLPGKVRAILARGLDPYPARRFESLDDLLDALERTAVPPRHHWKLTLALVATLIPLFALVQYYTRQKAVSRDDCSNPERVFAQTWTRGKFASGRVADAFEQFGKRWVDAYTQACRAAPSIKTARTTCLQGALDDVAALALMLRDAKPSTLEQFDAPGLMPNLGGCDNPSPLSQLIVPRQQPQRDRAIKILAELLTLRERTAPELDDTLRRLETDAREAGGAVLGSVFVTGANEYLRRGELAKARELYARFIKTPMPRNVRLEAIARLGLLEASMTELLDPHAKPPADMLDPRARPQLHPELANLFAAARSAARNDDAMSGVIAALDARARLQLGQWNRYRNAYADALEAEAVARRHFDAIGDARHSVIALADIAHIYLTRGDERALDDALFVARQASDILEQSHITNPVVDEIRARVAFIRRDFNEAHRRFDALSPKQTLPTKRTLSGRVVGAPPGKPVTVIAWHGDLDGDRVRGYTDPATVDGDIVQAAADGTFTIHAEPGWAILAEAKGMRSRPVVASESVTLPLVATTTMSGTATGRNLLGVVAFARYTVGESRFTVRAPIDRDDTYDLAGLPPGPMQLGLRGDAGDGTRTVTDLTWPTGQNLDIIVRGQTDATAHVFRGSHAAKTIGELDGLRRSLPDVASCTVHPIGADNTDAGRDVYQVGDHHCVITGNATGEATVCAADSDRVACQVVTLAPTVEVSYPDGRYAAGVTPVVLQL